MQLKMQCVAAAAPAILGSRGECLGAAGGFVQDEGMHLPL